MRFTQNLILILTSSFLLACSYNGKHHHYAPVYNVSNKKHHTKNKIHHISSFAKNNNLSPKASNLFNIQESKENVKEWQWPANGPVIGAYSAFNKGINIGGLKGDSVYAAAAGKVVYCGNGLRGYGNLIIIKHNDKFLTAYANNSKILVKLDSSVKQGQKIAEMGNIGTNKVKLHFEIRKNGLPVNPLSYLTRKG